MWLTYQSEESSTTRSPWTARVFLPHVVERIQTFRTDEIGKIQAYQTVFRSPFVHVANILFNLRKFAF